MILGLVELRRAICCPTAARSALMLLRLLCSTCRSVADILEQLIDLRLIGSV